ncbi:MAG TPA: type III secretion system inner membrane ring subunit SctD [Burkholderiaceae bacterium]|nr:type III secretion system inner membrane ring subunit SctD [Burkholderiaceae bacterium]
MKQTVRELRILSGLHAGAVVPVESQLVIGSDPECDIILDDDGIAPRHARLIIEGDHWALFEPEADLDATGTALPEPIAAGTLGEPCTHGPLCFAIEPADTPWKSQQDYHDAAAMQAAATAAAAEAAAESAPQPASPPAAHPVTAGGTWQAWHTTLRERLAGALRGVRLPQWRRVPRFAMVIVWIVLLGGAGVAAFMQYQSLSASRALEAANREAAARQKRLDAVHAALKPLGVDANVRVAARKDGVVTVTGWVGDDAALKQVQTALAALQPAPELHLTTTALMQQSLKEALQPYGTRLSFELQKAGNVRLSGGVKDGVQKEEILRSIKAQVPQIGDIEDYLMLPPQLVQMFRSQLRTSEFPDAEATWDGSRMVLNVKLSDDDRAAFERLLMDFSNKYGDVVPFVAQTPGDTRNAPKVMSGGADSLPFRVVSVIGGPMPFVVLDGGVKVMQGGLYKEYRLTSISDKELVFEGPQRIVLRR